MKSLFASLFILLGSIVITNEQIAEALPVGTPKEDVEEFLVEVAGEFEFYTRENAPYHVPQYPWKESEVGYYGASITNVQSKWWLPSFGAWRSVRVGIDDSGTVTQVVVYGGRSGFP